MNKSLFKILLNVVLLELLFLVCFELVLNLFAHEELEWIYYINIVIYSLIAILCWTNLRLSPVNKEIPIFIGIWATIMTPAMATRTTIKPATIHISLRGRRLTSGPSIRTSTSAHARRRTAAISGTTGTGFEPYDLSDGQTHPAGFRKAKRPVRRRQ